MIVMKLIRRFAFGFVWALGVGGAVSASAEVPVLPPTAAPTEAPTAAPTSAPPAVPTAPTAAPASVLAIAVNAGVGTVSVRDVKEALTGELIHWPNGTRVRIVLPPADSAAMEPLCKYVDTTCSELLMGIQQRVFRGSIKAPDVARKLASTGAAVASMPGVVTIAVKTDLPGVIWFDL